MMQKMIHVSIMDILNNITSNLLIYLDDWIDLPEDEVEYTLPPSHCSTADFKHRGVYVNLLKNPERYTGRIYYYVRLL